MTSHEIIPVPADFGAVLASPVAYQEWALSFPAPAPAPRVRRPGRIRRRAAVLAGLVVGAAAVLAGCGAAHHAPAPAGTPWIGAQAAHALQAVPADLGQVRHVTAHAHRHAPEGCHTPDAPSGTTITVDSAGNATAPYTGGLGYRCDGGTWVRIPAPVVAPAPVPVQPQRPVWSGHGTYPNDGIEPLCPSADAGHHAVVGSGADRFDVTCQQDGSEFAWGTR